jgi:asparagine synthase (glutamine-hydrolysing)
MCGFAGIIAWEDRYRFDRGTLERMSARIAHRGPDGQGLWINHEGEITPARPQVGLAHRRLAIIDLDERANQPFTDAQGHWLIYNGEIYNYRELRKELEQLLPNYPWRTQSDTEVLIASYVAWGEKCVEKLNGMFAFAIWDEPEQKLFVARDRMGQKPLYLAFLVDHLSQAHFVSPRGDIDTLNAIAFASELPALLEVPWINRREIDPSSLAQYLQYGFIVDDSTTIYRGVSQVQAGFSGTFWCDGASSDRYFWTRELISATSPRWAAGHAPSMTRQISRSPGERNGEFTDPVADTRRLVNLAVERQMVADVPVGCFLSGGVDSSVIAAAAMNGIRSRSAQPPLHTFSIGFDDPRYDESEYARRVAEHLGTTHHAFTVHPNAAEDLPKLAATFGQPFGDASALPTHYLARETRQHVKVALSGDGGDELFGGYDRYRAMRIGERLRTIFTPLTWHVLSPVAAKFAGGHPKSTGQRLARLAKSLSFRPPERYASYLRLMDDRLLRELLLAPLAPGRGLRDDLMAARFDRSRYVLDCVPAALAVDRENYLPADLLTKLDRASMLHALEVRSPFMDHHLVQFASRLTTPQLLKGGPKRMLREAFAGALPPWVFKRKKMGFAVPIGEWFRGQLRPMLRDHLFAADSFAAAHFQMPVVQRLVDEHEQQRQDHSQRLYALLMLELWWKTRGIP